MFFIKNNKMDSSNIRLSFPESFGIVTKDNLYNDGCVRFNSNTGLVRFGVVTIEFSLRQANESAREDLQKFSIYGTRLRSEIKAITRGNGTGYCAFFNGIPGYMDLYAEEYDFPMNRQGENRFDLRVFLRSGKGKKLVQTVEYALTIPIVKQFLDSIEYK